MKFPRMRDILNKSKAGESLTALEQFVGTYMPIHTDAAKQEFRRLFAKAVEEAKRS